MKVTTDTKQRLTTTFSFMLEFYKILMGTFLTVFVPQNCGDHHCSIYENIMNTEPFHFGTTMLNIFTFLFVLNFYRCELKREHWCIKYLDVDKEKPNDNLDHEVEKYPVIKHDMRILNKKYLQSVKLAIGFLVGNFAVSSVAIAHDYDGVNTVTSLVSFFLLMASKAYNSYTIGTKSVHDEQACSAYMKTPITYNTVDEDYSLDQPIVNKELEDVEVVVNEKIEAEPVD